MEYYRKDSPDAFIYAYDEIKSFKSIQKRDIVDNFLLGDFNTDGFYCIDKSILQDLVHMEKFYIECYNNTMYCTSCDVFGDYGRLSFAVKFFNPDEENAEAHLQILERINRVNGYYENTNIVTIAKFYGKISKDFVKQAMKAFNIKQEGTHGALREDERDAISSSMSGANSWLNILNRKNYVKAINVSCSKSREKIQKAMFEERINYLANCKFGSEIKKIFSEKYDRVEDFFLEKSDKFRYYKSLNELLDDVVDKHDKFKQTKDYDVFKKIQQKHIAQEISHIEKTKHSFLRAHKYTDEIGKQIQNENESGGNPYAKIIVKNKEVDEHIIPVIAGYSKIEKRQIDKRFGNDSKTKKAKEEKFLSADKPVNSSPKEEKTPEKKIQTTKKPSENIVEPSKKINRSNEIYEGDSRVEKDKKEIAENVEEKKTEIKEEKVIFLSNNIKDVEMEIKNLGDVALPSEERKELEKLEKIKAEIVEEAMQETSIV